MSLKKKVSTRTESTTPVVEARPYAEILDPAETYYERSRQDWDDYDRVASDRLAVPAVEQSHEPLREWGNSRSRQGFDPGTFRHRG
jgi:hypothetical protein